MKIKDKNTLLDKEYFELVETLDSFAKENSIPYVIVGGGAVQAHLSDILTNPSQNQKPLYQSMREARAQLEHVFRPTDDIDIVMLTNENYRFFSYELENHIRERFSPNIKKSHKSLGVIKNGHQMRVQLATDPKIYQGFDDALFNYQVESATELDITYDHRGKGCSSKIVVPKPEVLILPKISRFSSGDRIDIYNLTKALSSSGRGFDRSEVRSLVKEFAPDQASRLMKNLDEILNEQ